MGLTVTRRSDVPQPQRIGQQLVVEADILFDSSYPTGGEALTAAQCGLTRIFSVDALPSNDGYAFSWDAANSKLLAFKSAGSAAALAEVGNTDSLATTSTRAKVSGV